MNLNLNLMHSQRASAARFAEAEPEFEHEGHTGGAVVDNDVCEDVSGSCSAAACAGIVTRDTCKHLTRHRYSLTNNRVAFKDPNDNDIRVTHDT